MELQRNLYIYIFQKMKMTNLTGLETNSLPLFLTRLFEILLFQKTKKSIGNKKTQAGPVN